MHTGCSHVLCRFTPNNETAWRLLINTAVVYLMPMVDKQLLDCSYVCSLSYQWFNMGFIYSTIVLVYFKLKNRTCKSDPAPYPQNLE